jgi:general secretion pathway protein K
MKPSTFGPGTSAWSVERGPSSVERRAWGPSTLRIPHSALPTPHLGERGIALIIVMISITVMALLAGGFAYSMKVETKLARNVNSEAQLEWLGRSGVEYCRWILAEQLRIPGEPYDALNQVWAGGPGGIATTNSALMDVQNPVELGTGGFAWKITDLERKFNINSAPEPILQQALMLMGVDAGQMTSIINSILDWIDPDDNPRIQGAESDYYQGEDPPYNAKNGPIDDMSEMLLIKGITPELYWGPAASTNHLAASFQQKAKFFWQQAAGPPFSSGLVHLFTPLSSGRVNVNTASADVLQLIPGVTDIVAEAIVAARDGEDEGSGLTGPYRSVDQVRRVPEVSLEVARMLQQFCDVRSRTFQVQIDAHVGKASRRFIAVLGRNNLRDVQVLSFYWR